MPHFCRSKGERSEGGSGGGKKTKKNQIENKKPNNGPLAVCPWKKTDETVDGEVSTARGEDIFHRRGACRIGGGGGILDLRVDERGDMLARVAHIAVVAFGYLLPALSSVKGENFTPTLLVCNQTF